MNAPFIRPPFGELVHVVTLPGGCVVTFRFSSSAGYRVAWSPDVPLIRNARRRHQLIAAYRRARDEFNQIIAAALGGAVLTLDVADGAIEAATEIKPPTQQ